VAGHCVLGADVAGRYGWVGVAVDAEGFVAAHVAETLAGLIAATEPVAAVGVDIPIGNLAWGGREVDRAARALLGRRSSTIFTAPPTEVLRLDTYDEANQALVERGLPKLSQQSWALRHRMLDAATVAASDARVHEVGPELSFAAMNAGQPLPERKKSWAGARRRIDLLAAEGIDIPADLGSAGAVPTDDVLDAAAAAWTARRISRGVARRVPDLDEPERDPTTGRILAIHI
jgi:predicted RNase H-like nuclease